MPESFITGLPRQVSELFGRLAKRETSREKNSLGIKQAMSRLSEMARQSKEKEGVLGVTDIEISDRKGNAEIMKLEYCVGQNKYLNPYGFMLDPETKVPIVARISLKKSYSTNTRPNFFHTPDEEDGEAAYIQVWYDGEGTDRSGDLRSIFRIMVQTSTRCLDYSDSGWDVATQGSVPKTDYTGRGLASALIEEPVVFILNDLRQRFGDLLTNSKIALIADDESKTGWTSKHFSQLPEFEKTGTDKKRFIRYLDFLQQ